MWEALFHRLGSWTSRKGERARTQALISLCFLTVDATDQLPHSPAATTSAMMGCPLDLCAHTDPFFLKFFLPGTLKSDTGPRLHTSHLNPHMANRLHLQHGFPNPITASPRPHTAPAQSSLCVSWVCHDLPTLTDKSHLVHFPVKSVCPSLAIPADSTEWACG